MSAVRTVPRTIPCSVCGAVAHVETDPVRDPGRYAAVKCKCVTLYCPRCNGHHEREGAAEEKCQRETQFARADHRRRGGTI